MDCFRQDSAHLTSRLFSNEAAETTLEDKITRKRWARGVSAFYLVLFLGGAVSIGVYQMSSGTQRQTSLRTADHLNR